MITIGCALLLTSASNAQLPVIEIIKQATVRVIKAVDLQVQRWQNETIALQNAQRVLENALAALKLQEISGWVDRQRALYADYFEELWQVKLAVQDFRQVKVIIDRQRLLLREYADAWDLLQTQDLFNAGEKRYMEAVYDGILDATSGTIEQLVTVTQSSFTQMNDAQRLQQVNRIAETLEKHYRALQAFNRQNHLLLLQRARSQEEAAVLQKMYGLP